jgi:betaine-aldehyde dehydrogenase
VLNVVCGDRDTGRHLIAPPHSAPGLDHRVDPGWQGSCGLGRARPQADPPRAGGKAPVIVFDDADVLPAAEAIAMAGYFNAGQDCTAATRVLAGPRIHDDFVAALTEQARGTQTGGPSTPRPRTAR